MFNIKNYRLGFEFCGFILSLAILLPSVIWYFIPAPNDVLRSADSIFALGMTAAVLRGLTMLTSSFLINLDSRELKFNIASFLIFSFGAIYYIGWFLYYAGFANAFTLTLLAVSPVIMLASLAVDRKNIFALVMSASFAVVHIVCIVIGFASIAA